MKKSISVAAIAVSVSLSQICSAWSHTISIGYENVGPSALNFWYGTYHPGVTYTEGNFRLVAQDGSLNTQTAFSSLVSVKPSGLVDGDTNFYSGGSSSTISGTNTYGSAVLYWQGVSFTNLSPGTYTFTYVPIAVPTQQWQPINNAILSNTVTLSRVDLAGPGAPRLVTGNTYEENSPAAQSALAILDGGILRPTTSTTFSQPVSTTLRGGTIDTQNGDVTLSGPIDGRGPLTKTSPNTLFLTGANTNSGGLSVIGGAVNVTSDANLGSATAPLNLDGGSLQFGSSFATTATRPVTLGTGGGTFDTQGNNGTIAGIIAGAGTLNKTGAGILTLTGTNTYTGGTSISGGTLIRNTVSLKGNIANNGALVFNQIANGTYNNLISGSGTLSKTGTGTLTLGQANTYTGGTTISGGTVALGNASGASLTLGAPALRPG